MSADLVVKARKVEGQYTNVVREIEEHIWQTCSQRTYSDVLSAMRLSNGMEQEIARRLYYRFGQSKEPAAHRVAELLWARRTDFQGSVKTWSLDQQPELQSDLARWDQDNWYYMSCLQRRLAELEQYTLNPNPIEPEM